MFKSSGLGAVCDLHYVWFQLTLSGIPWHGIIWVRFFNVEFSPANWTDLQRWFYPYLPFWCRKNNIMRRRLTGSSYYTFAYLPGQVQCISGIDTGPGPNIADMVQYGNFTTVLSFLCVTYWRDHLTYITRVNPSEFCIWNALTSLQTKIR